MLSLEQGETLFFTLKNVRLLDSREAVLCRLRRPCRVLRGRGNSVRSSERRKLRLQMLAKGKKVTVPPRCQRRITPIGLSLMKRL